VFNAAVDASGGIFGTSEGTGAGAQNPVTGPLADDAVRSMMDGFVRPVEFDAALAALTADRVLVLSGPPGVGRRTGAVALAHTARAGRLVVLSPTQTLADLAERDLVAGTGYIVLDWFGVDRGCSQAESEYLWSLVARHVKESDAWLVLTRDDRTPAGRTAPVQTWSRPRPADVLRARLPDGVGDEAVAQAVAALSDDHSVSDLTAVAERMAAGEDPAEAVAREQRTSARERVQRWFAERPPRRDLTDVTALSLLLGAPERDYEAQAAALHARLDRELPPAPVPPRCVALPPGEAAEDEERDRLPERRGRRGSGGHTLIRVRTLDDGWVPRRHPVFVDAQDRDAVLLQLWERYDTAYWNVVRGWAETVADHPRDGVYLSRGLAALARVAFDEVHDVYLDGWSRQFDTGGWYTCLYTLWFMSMDDDLAPTALRTADHWLHDGTAAQVGTAVSVWSGHLGVRYPTDAFNRLWDELGDEDSPRRVRAALAIGSLFGSLVDRGGNGRSVISALARMIPRGACFGSERVLRDLLLTAVHATLSVPVSESLADGPLSEGWWETRQARGTTAEAATRPEPGHEGREGREGRDHAAAASAEGPGGADAVGGSGGSAGADGTRRTDRADGTAGADGTKGSHRSEGSEGSMRSDGSRASERAEDSGGPADAAASAQEKEERLGDPAVARHLVLHPDQTPRVAALWNAVIQYRPRRRAAILSLWNTLSALQRSGSEGQAAAGALLTELSAVMVPEDHEGFRVSFTALAPSRERHDSFTRAVLDILTRVFGRPDGIPIGPGPGPVPGGGPGTGPAKKATAV
jgi:hypothetical protein